MLPMTRRQALKGLIGAAGAAVIPGCAVNPVTGGRQLMLMTESQEIALGQQGHEDIAATYGLYDDTALQDWMTAEGTTMARVTHRPNLPYHFYVLDSPVVNAFALPGGWVYVTRGIMGYFNDEAQYGGVLGHELGHVNARHSAQQYSKAQLANLALGVGSVFSEEFARYAQFASVGMSLMFLKFSRDNEYEADRLGVEYSSKVGYDAVGMSEFFTTLERMRPAGGSLPEWQSTHPDPGNRINITRERALKFQHENPGEYVRRRNDYLERVEGVVFGDDPRQGYTDGGTFYHPALAISFPVPEGWEMANMPTEVRMTSAEGDGMLMFTLAGASEPAVAARSFAEANGVAVSTSGPVTVDGAPGYMQTGTLTGGEQTLGVVSHFIQLGGKVCAFHGIAASENVSSFPQFLAVPNGLRTLTDPARLNVEPERVRLHAVASAKPLGEALTDAGASTDQLDGLAILNGLLLTDPVPAGTRIKYVA